MEEVVLEKKEWLEILEQNKQYAKNYFVNYLIASNAVKLLEAKLKEYPEESGNPLVKENSGEVLTPTFPSPEVLLGVG